MKLLIQALLITSVATVSHAQTFTTLKTFGILTNATGFNPWSQLVQGPDGTLYGTMYEGEGNVRGTVYKIQPDGSGFTVLKWFLDSPNGYYALEGRNPYAGLTLSGGVLYGTTYRGGSSDNGTVFKLSTDGTGYTVLKHFTGPDGAGPYAGLTLSGSVLYGTTTGGGSFTDGTVFKVNTDGTGFAVLKNFVGSDGQFPFGGLTLSGNVLYGTTSSGSGGSANYGTVFKVNTDGTGFSVLKQFSGGVTGETPYARLALSGSVLYGTTYSGGSANFGTMFKLNTDGTGFTVLKHFNGSDGAGPYGELTLSGNVFYGTASYGGSSNFGTVFQVQTDGMGYTVLKHFTDADGKYSQSALMLSSNVLFGTTLRGGDFDSGTIFRLNTDGTGDTVLKHLGAVNTEARIPDSGLTLSGSMLYGVTRAGGSSNAGTVFKLNTDGSGYTVVKEFTGDDGWWPAGELTISGSVLYGTTRGDGGYSRTTVFKVNTDGTGHTVLKSFYENPGARSPSSGVILSGGVLYGTAVNGGTYSYSDSGAVFKLNEDGTGYTALKYFDEPGSGGMWPYSGLTLSSNTLYGTVEYGLGAVFKINTDGTGFTVLWGFSYGTSGMNPRGTLTLSGDTLYGTTRQGGGPEAFVGYGTVFKVNTDGSGFTVLKYFDGSGSDGRNPWAGLTLSGNTLYGTTYNGGSSGNGTVFKVNTDGTGYAVLKHFDGGDGANPSCSLTLSGSILYGTTLAGGSWNNGTAFKIDLANSLTPIPLTAQAADGAIILQWSDPAFALQAAPTVTGTYTNIPGATSPYTNAITGPQLFFRLLGN